MIGQQKVLIKELVFRENEGPDEVVLRIERSEQIASALKAAGLPIISAIPFEGRFVQFLNGRPSLIIPWCAGRHIAPQEVSRDVCLQVGSLLASIHQVSRTINPDIPRPTPVVNYHLGWLDDPHILSQSTILAQAVSHRAEFNQRLQQGYPIPQEWVLSHRDMNPGNLLDCNGTLMLLDWEMAGWSSPLDELVDAGLEWCHFCERQTNLSLFSAIIEGYSRVSGISGILTLNDTWQRIYNELLQAIHHHLYDPAEFYHKADTARISKAERYILQYYELRKFEESFSSIILKASTVR